MRILDGSWATMQANLREEVVLFLLRRSLLPFQLLLRPRLSPPILVPLIIGLGALRLSSYEVEVSGILGEGDVYIVTSPFNLTIRMCHTTVPVLLGKPFSTKDPKLMRQWMRRPPTRIWTSPSFLEGGRGHRRLRCRNRRLHHRRHRSR